jgi:hypothetical protein
MSRVAITSVIPATSANHSHRGGVGGEIGQVELEGTGSRPKGYDDGEIGLAEKKLKLGARGFTRPGAVRYSTGSKRPSSERNGYGFAEASKCT